jgi:membrane carboxypeptidase/penicillin-binding protein
MKRVQKPSPPKASLLRLIFRPLWAILTLGVWFTVGLSAPVLYYIYQTSLDLPDYASLAKYEPAVTTRVYAYDGSLIGEYARDRRIFMPISSVPPMTNVGDRTTISTPADIATFQQRVLEVLTTARAASGM